MSETTFTGHASRRVDERLRLSNEEVKQLLDQDKCVPLGGDGASNRVIHKLFYSEADSYWFVALQDERTGSVVTVLPIDFHRWRISGDALSIARARVCGDVRMVVPLPRYSDEMLVSFDWKLKFSVVVRNDLGKTRPIGLGSIWARFDDLSQALYDLSVRQTLNERLVKEIHDGEVLESLHVRLGKKRHMSIPLTTLS